MDRSASHIASHIASLRQRALSVALPLMFASLGAAAVPVLQVGAPGGAGEGTYANYISSLSNPTESETATTSGNILYVGGTYKNGDLLLGGKYGSTGNDWSSMQYSSGNFFGSVFNGRGAVLMATVAEGASGTITINGQSAFATSDTAYFPNNHDPVKDASADFLYFDIGNFLNSPGVVPDFASETGAADGQIKSLSLSISDYSWVHFDVMALLTDFQGQTTLRTTLENNPGSHDVTWKEEDGTTPPQEVPEPGILALLGIAVLSAGAARRGSCPRRPE